MRLRPTLAGALVRQQLEALPAVALEAADGVPAEVLAAAVLELALVDVWKGDDQISQREVSSRECLRVSF